MRYMECRHIKSNGCKCQSPALSGMPYCYFHARLHRALHNQKAVSAAAPAPGPDAVLDLPAVEDRTAIQLALTQVLQGMGSMRIDPRRGTQLLYGLQIATQLIDPRESVKTEECVQSVTTSEEGDELGPQEFICDPDVDKCDGCPFVNDCTKWEYTGTDHENSAHTDDLA